MPVFKKLRGALYTSINDFCRFCSLHCLLYLRPDRPLPLADRLFWLVVFVSSVSLGCYTAWLAWAGWAKHEFVIVSDSHVRPIWEVPFPSLTVCSFVAVKRSVVDLDTTNDTKSLFFSSQICSSKEFFRNLDLKVSTNEMKTFYDFLEKASPSCLEIMRRCTWQNAPFNCCEVFYPITTSIGRCFIANALPADIIFTNKVGFSEELKLEAKKGSSNVQTVWCFRWDEQKKTSYLLSISDLLGFEKPDKKFSFKDYYPNGTIFWTPDNGYPKPDPTRPSDKTYPNWSELTGYEGGLTIEVNQNMSEWQEKCAGGSSGFKVLDIHPDS